MSLFTAHYFAGYTLMSFTELFSRFTGKPCRLKWHPDYVPSMFTFKKKDEKVGQVQLARSHRLENRRNGCASTVRKSSQKCKSTNRAQVSQQIDEVPLEQQLDDEVPQVEHAASARS